MSATALAAKLETSFEGGVTSASTHLAGSGPPSALMGSLGVPVTSSHAGLGPAASVVQPAALPAAALRPSLSQSAAAPQSVQRNSVQKAVLEPAGDPIEPGNLPVLVERLEKRVATALRQMQARHESALDEAVQVLVGQLWSAYFSIGALQAHQQQLQQQVQLLFEAAQAHGWLGGLPLGAVGLVPPPGQGPLAAGAARGAGAAPAADSLTAETSSVVLSELEQPPLQPLDQQPAKQPSGSSNKHPAARPGHRGAGEGRHSPRAGHRRHRSPASTDPEAGSGEVGVNGKKRARGGAGEMDRGKRARSSCDK